MLSAREQLGLPPATLADMEAEVPDSPRLKFTDVPHGEEFERIWAIPRREVPDTSSPDALELADLLTKRYAKVSKPYPGPLRGAQAIALQEAWVAKGLVGLIGLGFGKTLIAYLLPTILGSKRPVYVCPSAMKGKKKGKKGGLGPVPKEFAKFYQSWHGPAPHKYPIVNYELLASKNSGEELDEEGKVTRKSLIARLSPDLIVLDECHYAANSGSATAKRIDAYLDENPDCIVVAMSGTVFKTSIKDASHIFRWALKDNAPLPVDYLEREQWASFLDVRNAAVRSGVGALLDFLGPKEKRQLEAAEYDEDKRHLVRKAVSRRIFETQGVVGTQEPSTDIPLTIDAFYPVAEDDALEAAFAELRSLWALPDDTQFADALEFGRYASTLGYSFWNRMEPAPPAEWKEARNGWAKWCRRAIRINRRGIDSEARMKDAVRKELYDDEGALDRWESERDKEREATGLQEPPSVAVWVSDEVVHSVAAWIAEHGSGAIWTKSIGLGKRLARDLNIPYYGEQGIDVKTDRHVDNHPGGPAVLSLAANGTGRNLQGHWHKNLWLCTPTEQALGRTHRPGQLAPVVKNWVYLGCAEHLQSFYHAKSNKSAFAEDMGGSPQRLRYAQTDMPKMRELEDRGGTRWRVEDK